MQLDGAKILLVGATGVLGSGLAVRVAERGGRLVVTGRDPERLRTVAEEVQAVHALLFDLMDVDACQAVVDESAKRLGGLDAVVVASGVAAFGMARDDDPAVVEEVFAVNTLGPMALVTAALKLLRPGSTIAVLTAVLADIPTGQMAAYSGSKSALSAYLSAVRHEVRRNKITIFDVRPPHLETGLASRALAGEPPRLPPGHDTVAILDLIITGIEDGNSELVADVRTRSISLR